MSKATDKKEDKESKEGHATDAQGNVLPPGSTVPSYQDPELAEKGIYQPSDKAANAAQGPETKPVDEDDPQAEHAKNLSKLPPVPSESAGAASQAK